MLDFILGSRFLNQALFPIKTVKKAGAERVFSPGNQRQQLLAINKTLESTELRLRRKLTILKNREAFLVNELRGSRLQVTEARRMQMHTRRLARRVLTAEEDERKEISRDLHDEIAQTLAGINVHLAGLKESAAVNNDALSQRISQTQALVGQSVQIVHRFARELRPPMLDDIGLIPAIRAYIRDLPNPKGLEISFIAVKSVENLNNLRRIVLYRVVQEALTNVIRHAGATKVTIQITRTTIGIRLRIADNGKSFSVPKLLSSNSKKRVGLLGMRERVEMVNGRFAIASSPSAGTTLSAEIPFRAKQRN